MVLQAFEHKSRMGKLDATSNSIVGTRRKRRRKQSHFFDSSVDLTADPTCRPRAAELPVLE